MISEGEPGFDEIIQFIESYKEDPAEVNTYVWISRIADVSLFGILIGLMLIAFTYLPPSIANTLPDILNPEVNSADWMMPVGMASVVLSTPIFYLSWNTKARYEITGTRVVHHYLAESLHHSMNTRYEEAFESLGDVAHRLTVDSKSYYNPIREAQIEELHGALANLSSSQRESWMEEQYIEFFSPICSEINSLEDDPDLWEIIDGIESATAEKPPLRQAIAEILSQANGERLFKLIQIVSVTGGTLTVGIFANPGWAALVPALYLIHQNFREKQE